MFTIYNEQEAKDELSVFGKMGARVVRGIEANKWRGKHRVLYSFEGRYDFYYTNYFCCIIKGIK